MTATEELEIRGEEDLARVRRAVRRRARALELGLGDQTQVVTAAHELTRNALEHAGGGRVRIETVELGPRRGLRLVFEDAGPGIADVEQAMTDGFSTASGLGLGLGGARRLVHELEIESRPGEGTRVSILRWKED